MRDLQWKAICSIYNLPTVNRCVLKTGHLLKRQCLSSSCDWRWTHCCSGGWGGQALIWKAMGVRLSRPLSSCSMMRKTIIGGHADILQS